jgi:riboflavin kinase/FMN adenylyltransferase
LGFPTINVETPTPERLPGIGVYATDVLIGGHWYGGMASVGRNITFGDDNQLTLEINLFDFSQMVYGEEVKVRWYQYLRGEEKFAGADELVAQMKRDEQAARQVVAHRPVLEDQILS